MINSMTAFARAEQKAQFGELSLELRTVNHRYLDLNFRLPEKLRYLEPELRTGISKQLQRGKMDITLNFIPSLGTDAIHVNQANLQQLIGVMETLQKEGALISPLNPLELLKWPGITHGDELDLEEVAQSIFSLLEHALKKLIQNRQREGAALSKLILDKVDAAQKQVDTVQTFSGEIVDTLRTKLKEKIKLYQVEVNPDRLEQEIVLQSQKADIAEELDRLQTHFKEIRRILKKGGIVGRRLDFLMQELNREANTLGSKAINTATTNASVELKVLIEQMREQIQNIE